MAVASTMILVISLLFLPILSSSATVAEEEFSEELLLKPLPDRKVLAHFHFQTEAPPIHQDSFARHHHLFPKSISQLVCLLHFPLSHFRVNYVFTFYNYH